MKHQLDMSVVGQEKMLSDDKAATLSDELRLIVKNKHLAMKHAKKR